MDEHADGHGHAAREHARQEHGDGEQGEEGGEDLRRELNQQVRKEIGALASPERIQFAPTLPKTRSGKIMRRILRKIAEGETAGFGDTSTLADPTVVDQLLAGAREFQKAPA